MKDEDCCTIKVLTSFNLYKFKMKYVSKEICRITFYDMLVKYLSKAIMFHTATKDIIKVKSQQEILEKLLKYDDDKVYTTPLENILHTITKIIIDFVREILTHENGYTVDETTLFFTHLASYISLLYESIHISDNVIIFTEDMRCNLYEEIETRITNEFIKRNYKVSIQILSINSETRYNDGKISVSNITFKDYQTMLSEINNGTVLL